MKPVKTALSKTRAKASKKNTPKKAPLKPKAARVTKTPKAVTAVIETDDQGLFIPFSGGVVKQKAYTDHFRLVTRPYTDRPSQFKAGDTVTIRRVSAQSRGYIVSVKGKILDARCRLATVGLLGVRREPSPAPSSPPPSPPSPTPPWR